MILEARNIGFAYRSGAAALTGVSLAIEPGRNVALVGESGAGKTTLLRILLGLAQPSTGELWYAGSPLARPRMRDYRRSVQAVFQDPYSSLDPRHRIGRIVAEPLRGLGLGVDQSRVAAALDAVGLPADAAGRYPHEFSGGQRQRIAIARAIVGNPRLLLADEPVSALDLTTRVRIVDLLASLCAERDLTIMLVSHDLGVVAELCQHTAVLEHGRLVEQGDTDRVLGAPSHPYTRKLIESVPRLP
ncbi:ABC-type glutathione transport system ATPase component [Actinoplanes lutulentus]|uniref:ABC-type dipeptide/oligopeptide/nickel transport system ATPase subunit n=1 Tax=Actinoplanes lutulentus TaxID=1287878 RepID=A0A327Z9Q2_9ACTN|nr:ABC transporter ATP-binding protein [Actinoplanes lutulentus]MBB2947161.1 ABC-type glutathione transport system ATPase component [Actinoplanes lutulentus]RAK36437.1 ABC-type dipeptide/oligopeptide/nickel transport system ATPase subunit [Actinoplanes lutulentus]